MEEGSSVDFGESASEKRDELNGLNITSEIVKEDENYEKSWSSFMEDSIDERATRALKRGNEEDLLPKRKQNKTLRKSRKTANKLAGPDGRPRSRVEALVDVIYSSMSSDIRRAACSVSPSPNRTNRRSSCGTFSAYSTQESVSTPTPRVDLTPHTENPAKNSKFEKRLQEETQSYDELQLSLNDDSLSSEPELDLAFKRHQTIDILSAAGNLHERRGVHGGYGTPSSYASEQEMKLYFGSTPISNAEFLGSDVDDSESTSFDKDSGWKAVALLDKRMKKEVISDDFYYNVHIEENQAAKKNGQTSKKKNHSRSGVTSFEDSIKELEDSSTFSVANDLSKVKKKLKKGRKRDGYLNHSKKGLKILQRKVSENDLKTLHKKRKKLTRKKSDAKNKLHKMLKRASESLIDKDLSSAMILNLKTPNRYQLPPNLDDLAPFDSFQQCLKELKSCDVDSTRESCEDFISEDFTPKTGSSGLLNEENSGGVKQHDNDGKTEITKFCETFSNGFFEEEFINDSIADTYRTPLGHEFKNDFSDESREILELRSSLESDLTSDTECRESEDTEDGSCVLDLSCIDSRDETYETIERVEPHGESRSRTEFIQVKSPVYFERDSERSDSSNTAEKQQDFDFDFDFERGENQNFVKETVIRKDANSTFGNEKKTALIESSVVGNHLGMNSSKNNYQFQNQEKIIVKSLDKNFIPNSIANVTEEFDNNFYKKFSEKIVEIKPSSNLLRNVNNLKNGNNFNEMAIEKYAEDLSKEISTDLRNIQEKLIPAASCDSVIVNDSCTACQLNIYPTKLKNEESGSTCIPTIDLPVISEEENQAEKGDKEQINLGTKQDNKHELLYNTSKYLKPKENLEDHRETVPEKSLFAIEASVLNSEIKLFEENLSKPGSSKQERQLKTTSDESEIKMRENLNDERIEITRDTSYPVKELRKGDSIPEVVQFKKEVVVPKSDKNSYSLINDLDPLHTTDAYSEFGKMNLQENSKNHHQNVNKEPFLNNHKSNISTKKNYSLDNNASKADFIAHNVVHCNKTTIIPKILITASSLEDSHEFDDVVETGEPARDDQKSLFFMEKESGRAEENADSGSGSSQNNQVCRKKEILNNLIEHKNISIEDSLINSSSSQSLCASNDVDVEKCTFKDCNTGPLLPADRNNFAGETKILESFQEKDSLKKHASPMSVEDFAESLKSKYIGLDEQIERILNPSPSPPSYCFLKSADVTVEESFHPWVNKAGQEHCEMKKALFDERKGEFVIKTSSNPQRFEPIRQQHRITVQKKSGPDMFSTSNKEISKKNFPLSRNKAHVSPLAAENLATREQTLSKENSSDDYDAISETLQFVKNNLNRDDECVKRLECNIRNSYKRILSLNENNILPHVWKTENNMSNTKLEGENEGPFKVRALEEVVSLLKKHVQQREAEINGLALQLRQSNYKIKDLEQKLSGRSSKEVRTQSFRDDNDRLDRELHLIQKERDLIQNRINERVAEKESAQIASQKARRDLDHEKEKQKIFLRSSGTARHPALASCPGRNNYRGRADDPDCLDRSRELESVELEFESLSRENRLLRAQKEQALEELQTDNTVMKEKLDRMNELSAENLLLQSDAADFQAELAELRSEAKALRTKCYELTEENRQCRAEIRDLRRYIDLLKANKTGDSRQDLLSKIEYYQMEHDRLIDEIRRLKQRLGEVSPRPDQSPRLRSSSPKLNGPASYPGLSTHSSPPTVKFGKSLERARSPVSDALEASSASSLAASRLVKDRSLSPSAALNIRDLTMDRYNQHMEGPVSPDSVDSDSTEMLLKPQGVGSGNSFMPSPLARVASDMEDDEMSRHRNREKCSDLFSSGHGRGRSSSSCRSPSKRSCSPANPGGFRSVTPKMMSTQDSVPDTARDRYPTKIKKSLPRRAFAPRSPADLKLGYCIKFTRPGGRLSRGTVKYIGHLPTRDEVFIGVELDGHDGKHSGTFQGTKYFTCPTNKGIFTPFSKVIMAWE